MLKKSSNQQQNRKDAIELPRFGRTTPAVLDDDIELYGQGFDEVGERVDANEMMHYSFMRLVDQIRSVLPVCVFLAGFQVSMKA
jgi:hypothetical protein